MIDTERLNLIELYKLEIRFSDYLNEWEISTFDGYGRRSYWARSLSLRTAIDEAMKKIRGFNNETTN